MIKRMLMLLCALPLCCGAQTLFLSWTSADSLHAERQAPRFTAVRDTVLTAWRGERVPAAALLYAPTATEPLALHVRSARGLKAEARYVGYVMTDSFNTCGQHPHNLQPWRVPDVVELPCALPLEAGQARPVWCTLQVDSQAKPGAHRLTLEVKGQQSGRTLARLALTVQVKERTLPAAAQWQFHTDFWQQPYAVSRYHGVPRWSEAHFRLLRPYLELLAASGQKVASAILFYEPWGDQSHDKFDPMVQTVRRSNGTWAYNYDVFDRWIMLLDSCGINRQINCFSMVPWDMKFRYFDEATCAYRELSTTTSSEEYKELWTSFLRDFAQHLRQRGWYERTCIAMDERGLSHMLNAYSVAQAAVPGMKMALAGTYHSELVDKLHDYCIGYGEHFSDDELRARRAAGRVSTTYTCCSTPSPNLFSNSRPDEAAYLPLYCVANGFDGYLHWSWMNWNDDPLHDTRFRLFAPGDTYLIYPGPRSSVRYERYIEGVQMAEKFRRLRADYEAAGRQADVARLDAALAAFKDGVVHAAAPAAPRLNALRRLLNE